MVDFYIAVIDYDSVPSQISTNFETLRSLNHKACIYKGTLSEKVTDLFDDVTPYDGVFFNPYGRYDPETRVYMTTEDVDDIYASKVHSIGEEDAIKWLESLCDAYVQSEYMEGTKVSNALIHEC